MMDVWILTPPVRFSDAGIAYVLSPRRLAAGEDRNPGEPCAGPGSRARLLALFSRVARDAHVRQRLRSLLSRSDLDPVARHRLGDRETLVLLAALVQRGTLVLEKQYRRSGTVPLAPALPPAPESPSTPADRPSSSQPTPRTAEKQDWIEIVLLDDDTGDPLSGIPLDLVLPDGRSVRETTDGNGQIRLDELTAGTCEIAKILDEQGFEVVSLQ
jgi:hypothetical protein